MKKVTIVCDGSSLGNGTEEARAGAVAVLIYKDKNGRRRHKVVGEFLGQATNNQAEIVAAAIGLEALREPCQVEVITDSRYVVQTLRGQFKQKKNHEFWARLREAAKPHSVTWSWTRGHADHPIQEECDRAARDIAARGAPDPAAIHHASLRVEAAQWEETD